MAFADRYIYRPSPYPEGRWETAAFPKEDCHFHARDGVRLHGWWVPSEESHGTVLYFHGNSGNISDRLEKIHALRSLNLNVFIWDYRGYGRSEGVPSDAGLALDARAAYEHVVHLHLSPTNRLLFYGESLGTAIAIRLASEAGCAGVVIQSGFPSIRDIADSMLHLPGVVKRPILWMLRTRHNSLDWISAVRVPKLFVHGTRDELIPLPLARRLFEAAPEPKEWWPVRNATHTDIWSIGGEEYLSCLRAFVQRVLP